MSWIIIIHARRTGRLFWSRATGQLRKEKWRPRSGVVWPFRFSLQQGAIEYLTPIVAGRVTAYIQELETLACAFVFGGKQTSPFSDWWVGLTLESATTGVRHDQARPGFFFCLLYFLWREFSCKFSTNPWRVLLLLPKPFFACSSSLKGSCKLSTNVRDFARFFGSVFFACSFLSKERCKFSTHLGDFSCFRFWSFFFLLA